MPVRPSFDWEQTDKAVILKVQIKGFKQDAIDVFISDTYVKINAHPTYLLQLDLLQPIDIQQSGYWMDLPTVKLTLRKSSAEPWETLCIDPKTNYEEVRARRDKALLRAEETYNTTLRTREQQKAVEKKRLFHEHWELERELRAEIEGKMKVERESEEADLAAWEEKVKQRTRALQTPGQVASLLDDAPPPVRRAGETKNVTIDFTPSNMTMPQRSRGDEDYYMKSRYKPVSIEDAPMFWKEKGDKLFRNRDWLGASSAYSESIKRDGSFLTCVMNRATCYLKRHEYAKCVEDCDLALTILSNTPASDTTQERYKAILVKLHVRRGAARAWSGQVGKALEDFRVAQAYRASFGGAAGGDDAQSGDQMEVNRDLDTIEQYMKRHAMVEVRDEVAEQRNAANHLYHQGNYAGAITAYRSLLDRDEYDYKTRTNLAAALLHTGDFDASLVETQRVVDFCREVAAALQEPGVQNATLADSDDEDEADDELVAKRTQAARTIRERSGHVYVLLKCYVRSAAALCGKKLYREAYSAMEQAVKITPYDDDLREDANRILEKMRMETLVGATKGQVPGAKEEESRRKATTAAAAAAA